MYIFHYNEQIYDENTQFVIEQAGGTKIYHRADVAVCTLE